jgi:hypothetical protein
VRPVAFLLVVLSAVLAVAAAGSATAATATPSIRVTFTGTAAGRFNDVERWVLLSSNECYLRRLRDQKASLSWNVSFSGGRSLATAGAATVNGVVSGTEVRDSCDDVAEELPPDAPADWLHSLNCSDPLLVKRAARATWSNGVLRVFGPSVALSRKAVCTAPVRSDELNAKLALPLARVLKLARGAQLRITVGSAKPATGNYRPRAYCLHIAKPYDGYRSFDQCVDTLRWSGTITITRL